MELTPEELASFINEGHPFCAQHQGSRKGEHFKLRHRRQLITIEAIIGNDIRRWHYRDHVSLREIAKRLGVSRNTVRRYIRAGTVVPTYPERQSPSKLDGFAAKLAGWLKTEANGDELPEPAA